MKQFIEQLENNGFDHHYEWGQWICLTRGPFEIKFDLQESSCKLIYWRTDGSKCQTSCDKPNGLEQIVEALIDPVYLPLCINMPWMQEFVETVMTEEEVCV